MPQTSTWYERRKQQPLPNTAPAPTVPRPAPVQQPIVQQAQPTAVTPITTSNWYNQRKIATGGPTAPTLNPTINRTPTPPPAPTARGTQVAPSIPTKPSVISRVGTRLYDAAKSMYDLTPLGQYDSAQRAYKDPAKLKAALPEFEQQLKDVQRSPSKQFETAANLIDPTGTVGGYTALGRQGIEDWRNQDYAGLGVDAFLATLPLTAYGTSRLIGKVRNKALLPKQSVVPDVHPPAGEIIKRQQKPWDFNSLGTQPVATPFREAAETPIRRQGIGASVRPRIIIVDTETPILTKKGKPAIDRKTKQPKVTKTTHEIEVFGDETPEQAIARVRQRKLEGVKGQLIPEGSNIVGTRWKPENEIAAKAIAGKTISGEPTPDDWLEGNPLYSHVPDRLRPEAPGVARLRASAEPTGKQGAPFAPTPERTRPGPGQPLPRKSKLQFIDEADYNALREKIRLRQERQAARKAGGKPTIESVIDKAKAKAGVNAPSGPPTITGAIRAIPGRIGTAIRNRPLLVSNETQLRRLGPVGNEIANLFKKTRTRSGEISGEQLEKVRRVVRGGINSVEEDEIVSIMNGEKQISQASSPKIADAVSLLRTSTDEPANRAIAAGVRMRNTSGESVPFQKYQGEYFPHRYDEKLFEDLPSLERQLIADGKSPREVKIIMDAVKERGERFHSAQHSRDTDLPGWKRDLKSLEQHHLDMGDAIARAEVLGPNELGDANSTLSQLIAKSENPELARKISEQILGRGAQPTKSAAKWMRRASGFQAGTKLSLQMITNLSDIAASMANVGVRSTVKGIAKTITKRHEAVDYATKTGALNITKKNLIYEGERGKLTKLFTKGIDSSEKFVRTIEALAGRVEAERIFNNAKKNPAWKKRLAHFIDDDIDEVMKQDKLSETQLRQASGRAAEISSGVPDELTLSRGFYSNHPAIKLPLLFKRFAFLGTKNLVEAFKSAPTKTQAAKKVGTMLAAYYGIGEATGDMKAIIKGLASGDIEKAVSERGEYWDTGNPALDRALANYMQSALFGILGDVGESVIQKSVGKVSGTAGGPIGSDLDELASIIFNPQTETGEPKSTKIKRALARRIPYTGGGLAERFYPREEEGSPFGGFGGFSGPSGF